LRVWGKRLRTWCGLCDGQLEKQAVLTQDHAWRERRVVLTDDELLFARPDDRDVMLAIQLHEVTHVEQEKHHVFAGCEFGIGKTQEAASFPQLPVSALDWANPDETANERNLHCIR
jgi:hypothetical protein